MTTSRSAFTSAAILFLLPQFGFAQDSDTAADAPFDSGESSLMVGSPHPELFPDLKVDGFDYLEGSIKVEDKAASVSWAPFLMNRTYSWLSETRLQLSQADDITSLGLSLKYNPLNPRSDNGKEIWNNPAFELKSDDPLGINTIKQDRLLLLEEETFNEILTDVDRNTATKSSCRVTIPMAIGAHAKFLKVKNKSPEGAHLREIRCALTALREDFTRVTSQLESLEDDDEKKNLRQENKELLKAYPDLLTLAERGYYHERTSSMEPPPLSLLRQEISLLSAEIEKARDAYAARAFTTYREQLYATCKPVLNLSYVASFFKVLSGGEVDADDDDLLDNEHQTKSRTLTLTADWRFKESNGLSLLVSRSKERASAEEGAFEADYDGYGATWSYRIKVLNEDGFRNTKAYRESLFVPSIIFGLAYEQKDCSSPNEECADGLLRNQSLTPFFDFKINKGAQFRIGLPLQRKKIFRDGTETEEESVDIVSLFAVQLGRPN